MASKSLLVILVLTITGFCLAGDKYDYIVIGGGSAGAIAAARLSDDPTTTTLVLERGQDDSAFTSTFVQFYDAVAISQNPSWTASKFPFNKHHFSVETTMGAASQYIPSPDTLGGGGSVNGNAYNRATDSDFYWFNSSLWTHAALLNDIKSLESCQGPYCDPANHGLSGPIAVNTFAPNPIEDAFFWAMQRSFNVNVDFDFNDGTAQGVGYLARNINISGGGPLCQPSLGDILSNFKISRDQVAAYTVDSDFDDGCINVSSGKPIRQDSWTKVLRPVLSRGNLALKTSALVLEVELDLQKNQHTVYYLLDNKVYSATARREVIFASGAYNDPRLLMLSGIGNCTALASLGITCIVNNPQVGQNLHESTLTVMIFVVTKPSGPSAQPGNIPCVYSTSQWYAGPVGTDQETAMTSISPSGGVYLGALTQNRNNVVGSLTLRSADPHVDPVVSFNLNPTLADAYPLADQVMKFRAAMDIVASNLSIGVIEISPGTAKAPNNLNSIASYLNSGGATAEFHYVGTASIQKVVNERLQLIDVQGNVIKGVRVASNAIIPQSLGIHGTHSTSQLIGTVCARFIKEDWS